MRPADKGVALAMLDKVDYSKKAENLLEDGATYKTIAADPTNRQKNRLINVLKKIMVEEGINNTLYRKIYPTGACATKCYGLPRYIIEASPAGIHQLLEWQKTDQGLKTTCRKIPPPYKEYKRLCRPGSQYTTPRRGMHHLL